MAYSELVKSLNPIRSYLRDFFVYGFKNRNDFPESSRRSYDNEKRRIESWLSSYMDFHTDEKKKNVFLSIDSREASANPLFRVFLAKSFTDMDAALHFFLIDALYEKEMTVQELSAALPLGYDDESTIRKKCKEYETLGLFAKRKEGRKVYYRLTPTLEIEALTDAIAFASEILPLGAAGVYLSENFSREPIPLSFKHHYIFSALDEEILETLLAGISEKRNVRLHMTRGEDMTLFPWKICISTENGRQYLFGLSAHRPTFCRLDRIEAVKLLDADDDSTEKEKVLAAIFPHLWGVSGGSFEKLYHVEMVIQVEAHESFLIDRLQRERRCGTVSRVSPGLWKYEVDLYHPMEMIPWLRTFIGRMVSLRSDHPLLEKRFRKDLEAMYKLYEEDAP